MKLLLIVKLVVILPVTGVGAVPFTVTVMFLVLLVDKPVVEL